MPEQWINAVVTITKPLDLPLDATPEQRQDAVAEFMDDVVIENDVVATGRTEIVEDGHPIGCQSCGAEYADEPACTDCGGLLPPRPAPSA